MATENWNNMSTQKYYVKILIIQNNLPPGAPLTLILYNNVSWWNFTNILPISHTKLSINCIFLFAYKSIVKRISWPLIGQKI